ncbi:Glutathione-dependent formaldehyde-activating enzyme [Mycena kentingensis (nom. inval.)]|nr:Glutathione-dependent formaldehyde-activating enzyme [Mycena kentingensis (nom. inval.)]
MSDPATTPAADTQNIHYKGACHCGAFEFSFKLPEITKTSECDCSYCARHAYIWARTLGTFAVDKGAEEDLVGYNFGTKALTHKFCGVCGSSVFGRYSAEFDNAVSVNLRCVDNIDIYALAKGEPFKGSAWGDAYSAPAPIEPAPASSPADDGATVYHGNCHCGAIGFALTRSAEDGKITTARECNCSICRRDGVAWVYPRVADVTFRGVQEKGREYTFGRERCHHVFCTTCGDSVYTRFSGVDAEGKERSEHCALNVRLMNDLDLGAVEMEMFNGKDI